MARKDLKHPDVIQEKLTQFFKELSKYTKELVTIGIVALAVLIAVMSYNFLHSRRIEHDEALFYSTMHNLEKKDPAQLEQKLSSLLPKLKTEKVRCYVAYRLADLMFQNKHYDKAEKTYKQILNNASGVIQELARFGLAKTYSINNKTEKAKRVYKEIVKDKYHVYRALSMLNLARIYAKENNKQLALASLENLIISYKNTTYEKIAQLYKEELK